MAAWIDARVTGQHRWTDRLYSLEVEAEGVRFEAGQFAKLALDIDGAEVARPYSFVNPPGGTRHEFYYITVPGGPLTTRLPALQAGDAIRLASAASGFLVLSEVPAADNLWLLSTGTGIGPFLSILGTDTPWQRYRGIVLVHAVRESTELSYRSRIEQLMAAHPQQFRYVPMVSREAAPGALAGRIPAAIADARLEQAAGLPLAAQTSQVMLCGNPDMVRDTMDVLKARGMKKHRRRDPGHITTESYW